MSPRVEINREKLAAFCEKWRVTELSLFGSVLRDDFRPDSDVDVMVAFAADSQRSLFDLVSMQEELEGLFGRKVDLVTRSAIEGSENYIRRRNILRSLEPVYVA
jgi:predicted nucleotidyltransferase